MNPDYMPSEGTADDIALLLLSTPVPAMTLTGVARAFPKLPSNDLLKLCLAVTQVGYSLNTPEIFDGKAWLKPAHTMSQMTGTMTGLGNRGHISMFRVAADPQTGAQISYGDSGGPALVRDSKGDWVLVGVTAAETYCKTGIISAIFQQKSFVTQTLYNFWKMSAQMKLQNFFAKVFVDPWKSVKGDLKRITLMKEVLEPRLTLSKKGNENTRTNDLDITVVKEDLLRNAYGLPAPSGFNHSSVVEAKAELSKGLTWGNVRNYVQRCGVLVAGFLDLTDEQRLGSEFSPEMKMDIVTCANNMRTLWDFSARLISWNKNRELNPELAACPLGVFLRTRISLARLSPGNWRNVQRCHRSNMPVLSLNLLRTLLLGCFIHKYVTSIFKKTYTVVHPGISYLLHCPVFPEV